MQDLAADASEAGRTNISFLSRFLLGRVDDCIDTLVQAGRIPEAAFFARTYKPSRISEVKSIMSLPPSFLFPPSPQRKNFHLGNWLSPDAHATPPNQICQATCRKSPMLLTPFPSRNSSTQKASPAKSTPTSFLQGIVL